MSRDSQSNSVQPDRANVRYMSDRSGNVLFITVDQLRADCLSSAGHPLVQTPNLDRLAADGVAFRRHYAQSTPCGPSRASLLTGQYLQKHRSGLNGTPMDARFTNVALEARAAGYDPVLFGYTDNSPDPRVLSPDDPRLRTYEGVLPGFRSVLYLPEHLETWGVWLRKHGYDVPEYVPDIYAPISDAAGAPPIYSAEHTEAAFLVEEVLDYLDAQGDEHWFAHATFIRPHPPYIVPEPYASMFDPADVSLPNRQPTYEVEGQVHPLLAAALSVEGIRGPDNDAELRQLRATYYGMIAEVDAQLGVLFEGLKVRGLWQNTLIVLTADHGEQLGDHWLWDKLGWFDQSYHIPLIVRDPRSEADDCRGSVVEDRFTENVDVMPTILDWIGAPIPVQCDGRSLLPITRGADPGAWRDAAYWEWEFRDPIGQWAEKMHGITSDQCAISVLRDERGKYVHFAAMAPLFYDLETDPDERINRAEDPAYASTVLRYAQRMLSIRMEHVDQTLTWMVVTPSGVLDGRRRLRAVGSA